jgi:hypothetical protein
MEEKDENIILTDRYTSSWVFSMVTVSSQKFWLLFTANKVAFPAAASFLFKKNEQTIGFQQ